MTYKQAYDKIIEAYFKDEITPFNPNFCFCGTLANGPNWRFETFAYDAMPYSYSQFGQMEKALFSTFPEIIWRSNGTLETTYPDPYYKSHPEYEDFLFSGMCAALEVLKDIHRSRGENVDELPALKPRKQII